MGFRPVAELEYDATTLVYEHGWQSWSPSGWYPLTASPPRPTAPNHHVMAYRPGVTQPGPGPAGPAGAGGSAVPRAAGAGGSTVPRSAGAGGSAVPRAAGAGGSAVPRSAGGSAGTRSAGAGGSGVSRAAGAGGSTVSRSAGTPRFQGEGLLAVATGGEVLVAAAKSPDVVPSIRAELVSNRLVISADGDVDLIRTTSTPNAALADWADAFAARHHSPAVRVFGPSWCSWYAYWGKVTERDVMAEVRQFDQHELSVDMVLLDEGYQAEIGDWLTPRDDFGSTVRLASDIRSTGRRAGIWVAPFLVGSKSETARLHPEWLVPDITAGTNWGQEQLVLDVTHPGAARHLQDVFTELCRQGYDHFKLDFVYAGAIEGRRHEAVDGIAAYRHGMRLLREAVGPNRILHGCGAPILPSFGLVDCMRISPDTDPLVDPPSGDISQPGQRGARSTSIAREFLHGRWWANDPDCLIVQPDVQDRERWAEHVENAPGLRMSSDPIGALDRWGLDRTRELLTPSSPRPHPLKDPDA